jgi:hypothetical protein
MLYIYQTSCISPQPFPLAINNFNTDITVAHHGIMVVEPDYADIPVNILRRMGKAVRMGVGAALPIIAAHRNIDGIVIGTANGSMEDSIKFLNQIVDYKEGMLTPTNFVQSTPNAVAAQLALLSENKLYNTTHVHRGLAFENALLDVMMLCADQPQSQFLLGGLDEISTYNHAIEYLGGWYKSDSIDTNKLYQSTSVGTIAGEGASMFLVGQNPSGAIAKVSAILSLHAEDMGEVADGLSRFLIANDIDPNAIDTLILGENGDIRFQHFYQNVARAFPLSNQLRYKHLCGEYTTASSFALSLASLLINCENVPSHLYKDNGKAKGTINNILLYNTFKGLQHSFIYVQSANDMAINAT